MSTLVIIQARLGSQRLPGKVLADIGGWPAWCHVHARAVYGNMTAILAVPAGDGPLIESCEQEEVPCFAYAGPEADVLGRYVAAVAWAQKENHAADVDVVVRLTADCPFVPPHLIWAVTRPVEAELEAALRIDTRGPGGYPDGCDVEAFTLRALLDWDAQRRPDDPQREHVTPRSMPVLRPAIIGDGQDSWQPDFWRHRWTLDTADDLAWFRRVAEHYDVTNLPHPTMGDLLALGAADPALLHLRREEV